MLFDNVTNEFRPSESLVAWKNNILVILHFSDHMNYTPKVYPPKSILKKTVDMHESIGVVIVSCF